MDVDGKRRPNPSGAKNFPSNGQSVLSGWARIENWMATLDRGMVQDFHEDINTLLTFAGLFSAVVTAFLIQLYLGLQPDSSQTTNNLLTQTTSLLGQISQQLANHSIAPVDIPTPSPPFQASASMIWINTLWFLSLVLSLAAALFGMISKQWLREYLQWTTMSGPSENQVALRQGRYEAFMDWNTPAIIASMPVLLELALMLFLLGMEVLLWTLNTIVFGVCTVAVVSLIAMAVVAMVLPVLRARCPYKSPVGWALVLVKSALHYFGAQCVSSSPLASILIEDYLSVYRERPRFVVEKDWRGWDIARQTWCIDGKEWIGTAAALGRHRMLTRALWWVQENSQDQRLMEAADEGLANRAASPSFNAFKVLVADFFFACEHLRIDPARLVPPEEQCAAVDEGEAVINIFDISIMTLVPFVQYEVRLAASGDGPWQFRNLDVNVPPAVCVWIAHLLFSDLLAVVAHYNSDDMVAFGKQADYFLQALVLLSGSLAVRAARKEKRSSIATDRLAQLIDRLCRDYATLPPRLTHLFSRVFASFDWFDELSQDRLGYWPADLLTFPSAGLGDLPYTHLALNIPSGHPDNWTEADCSVFVHISRSALREWRTPHEHDNAALLSSLFDRMTSCVRRCHRQRWRDCAMKSRNFIKWLDELDNFFNPDAFEIPGRHLAVNAADIFPYAFVDAVQQYDGAGLVFFSSRYNIIPVLVRRSTALKAQRASHQAEINGAIGTGTQLNEPLSMPVHPPASADIVLHVAGPSILHLSPTAESVDSPRPVDGTAEIYSRTLSHVAIGKASQDTQDSIAAAAHDITSIDLARFTPLPGPLLELANMTSVGDVAIVLPAMPDICESTFPAPDAMLPHSSSAPPPFGSSGPTQGRLRAVSERHIISARDDAVAISSSAADEDTITAANGQDPIQGRLSEHEGTVAVPFLNDQHNSPDLSLSEAQHRTLSSSPANTVSSDEYCTGIQRQDVAVSSIIAPMREYTAQTSTVDAVDDHKSTRDSHNATALVDLEVFKNGGTTRGGGSGTNKLQLGDAGESAEDDGLAHGGRGHDSSIPEGDCLG